MMPRLVLSFGLFVALIACASPSTAGAGDRTPPPESAVTQARPAPRVPASLPAVTARVIGLSVEDRPIEARSLGHGTEVVLIIATIHGDESAGTPLLARLETELLVDDRILEGRRVILVPVANPDGYAHTRRTNARGIDLNRNFPAENFRPSRRHGSAGLAEPESRALHDLVLAERPDRVVSLHQPLQCVDWDGPGEELARAMALVSDLPARRLGSRPGSFGSWVGETLGIPIITLELPRAADALDADALWERYGSMMLRAISFRRA